jgi:hypothetical protein
MPIEDSAGVVLEHQALASRRGTGYGAKGWSGRAVEGYHDAGQLSRAVPEDCVVGSGSQLDSRSYRSRSRPATDWNPSGRRHTI